MTETERIVLDGESLALSQLEAVARHGAKVELSPDGAIRDRIASSRALNEELVSRGMPIYGVTTGIGSSVDRHVGGDRVTKLQANLITYMGCGLGDYLPVEECRAMLLARVNCFAKGYSGVRLALIERLTELLNRDIIPCVPLRGSLGASGDLIPSSYLGAVVMGRREVYHQGVVRPTEAVYREVGLRPLPLESKEGLAILNGTAFMTGVGALAALDAERLGIVADACTALAIEVLLGITGPFAPFLHTVKPHPGLAASAARIARLLGGSHLARDYYEVVEALGTMKEGVRRVDVKIQDKYSLRCAPHCIGALYDMIRWIRETLEVELNSSNDNPLYDLDAEVVRSGGNFSGYHIGMAMDTLKTAVASVGDNLDRQLALVIDETYNNGLGMACVHPLPPEHPEAGTRHGVKSLQLLISAVTAEALNACVPMTVFSRSTGTHNQDKVSMGAIAARQAREVVGLVQEVAAIHLIVLCQAADRRDAAKLAPATRRVYEAVRSVSPYVEEDRELREDIQRVVGLIRSGELASLIEQR